MEKLIELLNKYLKTKDTEIHRTPKVYAFEEATKSFIAENGISYRQERVISKRFEFIKWLVNEDKIDTNKLEKIWYEKTVCRYDWQYREIVEYSDYESLLMLLSIQDKPIEFLISVIK